MMQDLFIFFYSKTIAFTIKAFTIKKINTDRKLMASCSIKQHVTA